MRVDNPHAAILVDVVAREEKAAHLEAELTRGMAWGVPHLHRHVADLDGVVFVERQIHLAAGHGDFDPLGLDGGIGHDFVAGLQGRHT